MFGFLKNRKAKKARKAAELQRQKREQGRLEENRQICFALQVQQNLYKETSETWTSLASVEAAAVAATEAAGATGRDMKIELPETLVKRMRTMWICPAKVLCEIPVVVEIVVQNSNPRVKLFLRWGGAGEPVEKREKVRIITKEIGHLARCSEESIEQGIFDMESFERAVDVVNECVEASGFKNILAALGPILEESESEPEAFPAFPRRVSDRSILV